jgi:serine/threonine-protein kinase
VLADDDQTDHADKPDDLLAPSAPAPAPAPALTTSTSDDSTAAASDSGAHGTLRINSRPWSQVYVDGKLIGNTPQMSIDVKAGAHNVRLVNSEFSMSKVIELNVAPGEVVSRVELLDE